MPIRLTPALAILMALTVVASAAAAYLTARLVARPELHSHAGSPVQSANLEYPDLHEWMHEQLELSEEQHSRLDPIETAFATQRDRLNNEVKAAEKALALAIHQLPRNTAEINRHLEELDRAHAQLRRLTLNHLFDMERHLNEAQAGRLRQWTHDSLIPQL